MFIAVSYARFSFGAQCLRPVKCTINRISILNIEHINNINQTSPILRLGARHFADIPSYMAILIAESIAKYQSIRHDGRHRRYFIVTLYYSRACRPQNIAAPKALLPRRYFLGVHRYN